MKKIVINVVAGLVILFIGVGIGNASTGSATVELNHKKLDAIALDKKISGMKNNLNSIKGNLSSLKDDLNSQKAKNKEVFAMIDQKSKVQADLKKAKNDLSSVNDQVSSAKNDLKSKQAELASVSGQIVEAKGAPKTLQAGTYTVGSDVPAGKYIVTPIGEGSNFFTFDTNGTPDVNTILGSAGVPSYRFEIADGYKIQTESPVKLTPIK